jgi:hypothetical protein
MKLLRHPVVLFGAGVLVGAMFHASIAKVPGVNKLPNMS